VLGDERCIFDLSFVLLGWLAELRRVTAVFIGMDSLTFTSTSSLAETQRTLMGVQKILVKFEGTLKQFMVDGELEHNDFAVGS
jgi:hypothetical protein